MKVAMRVVSLQKQETVGGVQWIIYSIYESVAIELLPGRTVDKAFRRKDGSLNAAAQNPIKLGMKDIAWGYAHKLEVHLVTYE